ncbi:hypothetical protein DAQ1742_03375 [Dickeya aquatica]|uniref:Uncharacterized protein n=1 Tax=Dickeya aquatica TaxID=1401087 RepID=A0A375ADK9_9GAMM|nr:hypothetical protein DAQ1742_03375 [Dickeya aquatica]
MLFPDDAMFTCAAGAGHTFVAVSWHAVRRVGQELMGYVTLST